MLFISGDYGGIGATREKELVNSCATLGIDKRNILSISDEYAFLLIYIDSFSMLYIDSSHKVPCYQ